jgi:hypothetical protein
MIYYNFWQTESLSAMSEKVFFGISKTNHGDLEKIIERMAEFSKCDGMKSYTIEYIKDPIFRFREGFLEWIINNGTGSLLKFQTAQDDILSNHTPFNDVLRTCQKFVTKLSPAKNLLIIDPYFYAESGVEKTSSTLNSLLTPILDQIEAITVIHNKKIGNESTKQKIKENLDADAKRSIKFKNIQSKEFHDRFWINPDTKEGIVIGTSLNGIGCKLMLIDKLSRNDTKEILDFIKSKNINIVAQ